MPSGSRIDAESSMSAVSDIPNDSVLVMEDLDHDDPPRHAHRRLSQKTAFAERDHSEHGDELPSSTLHNTPLAPGVLPDAQSPPNSHSTATLAMSERGAPSPEPISRALQGQSSPNFPPQPRVEDFDEASHRRRSTPEPADSRSPRRPRAHRERRSPYRAIREFLGHGNPARRRIITFIGQSTINIAQIVFAISFIALSTTKWKSPRPSDNERTEWDACDKALGPLDAAWMVRACLGLWLSIWQFRRTDSRNTGREGDVELQSPTTNDGITHHPIAPTQPSPPHDGTPPNPRGRPTSQRTGDNSIRRLASFQGLLVGALFVATNWLLFSSINTCRISSPHIWWLSFAFTCSTWFVILEVFLLCFTVFLVMPLLFVLINVGLILLGRRPISARRIMDPSHINAEVPKIPQKVVDKIPLVLYIPVPGEGPSIPETAHVDPRSAVDPDTSPAVLTLNDSEPIIPSQVALPVLEPSHPSPNLSNAAPQSSWRKRPLAHRFAFLRRKKQSSAPSKDALKGGETEEHVWEDQWEKSELPFVRLESHRAACAICLLDFDEPRRKGQGENPPAGTESGEVEGAGVPEPLRLLECGHVFHKTCLDPWLTGVSGRCPTCQRPVEIEHAKKKTSRRRHGAAGE